VNVECTSFRWQVDNSWRGRATTTIRANVRERQDTSANELPPVLVISGAMKDSYEASGDEDEVPDASDEHPHGVWLLHKAGFEKNPQLADAGLHEVSHEQAERVPEYRNCESSTAPPRTADRSIPNRMRVA
jgi:hypothetical protein